MAEKTRGVSDNAFRKLPKDGSFEALLRAINERLAESPDPAREPRCPLLYIAGGPRSGTTIAAQLFARCFDADYVDNLAAMFWRAPTTGLQLSAALFGSNKIPGANSEFGRTHGADIHGFHYFWIERLGIETTEDLFDQATARRIDWSGVSATLAEMQSVKNKPLVLKGYYPAYFMQPVIENIPKSHFILIERDPYQQACSIKQARLELLRNIADWWSMYPPNYASLLDRDVDEQIAGQVHGLRRYFREQVVNGGIERHVSLIDYDEMVERPAVVAARVATEVENATGYRINTLDRYPQMNIQVKKDRSYDAGLWDAVQNAAPESPRQT